MSVSPSGDSARYLHLEWLWTTSVSPRRDWLPECLRLDWLPEYLHLDWLQLDGNALRCRHDLHFDVSNFCRPSSDFRLPSADFGSPSPDLGSASPSRNIRSLEPRVCLAKLASNIGFVERRLSSRELALAELSAVIFARVLDSAGGIQPAE